MSRIIPSLTSPLSYAELGPMFATPADHKTTDTIQFLEELNAGDLFKRDTWPKLRGTVYFGAGGFGSGVPNSLFDAICASVGGTSGTR